MFPLTSRTDAAWPEPQPGRTSPAPADREVDWRRSLRVADRACCCSARPAIAVILPPTAARPHATDLLLCGHHYRAAEQARTRAGAIAFDSDGLPLTPESWLAATA